jgi:hypothetical protein
MTTITITRSKRGVPCLWEQGGGATNTGHATIICTQDGQKKRPIYIRRSGSLACGKHALIPVQVGDLVIQASHYRRDFDISVYRIAEITDDEARMEQVDRYSYGEWTSGEYPPENLMPAIRTGMEKATCYHCREPHYVEVI